ncbi:hypothetical protein N431DRAFT_488718 [Stipitochalara longipes BDJ]|nr:hypothetical protein N431DRAFT_488718 [Stipitochalara longipes BDJ]
MFTFVDGLSNSYQSTTIRSHVMTNAYQAKKRLQGNLEGKPSKPTTWMLELVPSPGASGTLSSPDSVSGSLAIEVDLADDWVSNHPSTQPRTILGAGRIDHFSTLPIPRTELIDEFVAAYLGPGVDYGLGKRRDTAYNYRFHRFKAALSDECSFYAILMWSNRLALLTGNQRTACNALHFKTRCLQIMGERLSMNCSRGTEVDIGTMYGALDLSNEAVRNGETEISQRHWQGLREMVVSKGGLCNIIHNVPLIYSILWHYMALALDQEVQWDYIPPMCTRIRVGREVDELICAEELMSFITRLQQPENTTFLNHCTIASSLHSGTILHAILCGATSSKCSKYFPAPDSPISSIGERSPSPDGHSLPQQLRRMQAPRLPIFVFMLAMLMDIKSRTNHCLDGQLVTLVDFFAVLERAMYDNHFDEYPHGLENVLMVFIRGFDISLVPCSELGKCILHRELAQERFPRWPLIFSVMRVMGALRRLNPVTRKRLEIKLRDILVAPGCDFTFGKDPSERRGEFTGIIDSGLGDLKEEICGQLALC